MRMFFVEKLYDLLESGIYVDVIDWAQDGTTFVVKNPAEFSKETLKKVFRHTSFASLIRQLNLHDFHKLNRSYYRKNSVSAEYRNSLPAEYFHKNFRRGRRDLLNTITRHARQSRTSNNSSGINDSSSSYPQQQQQSPQEHHVASDRTSPTSSLSSSNEGPSAPRFFYTNDTDNTNSGDMMRPSSGYSPELASSKSPYPYHRNTPSVYGPPLQLQNRNSHTPPPPPQQQQQQQHIDNRQDYLVHKLSIMESQLLELKRVFIGFSHELNSKLDSLYRSNQYNRHPYHQYQHPPPPPPRQTTTRTMQYPHHFHGGGEAYSRPRYAISPSKPNHIQKNDGSNNNNNNTIITTTSNLHQRPIRYEQQQQPKQYYPEGFEKCETPPASSTTPPPPLPNDDSNNNNNNNNTHHDKVENSSISGRVGRHLPSPRSSSSSSSSSNFTNDEKLLLSDNHHDHQDNNNVQVE